MALRELRLKSVNVALFASGTGTNVENILRFSTESSLNLNFACIITDNPNAPVIEIGKRFNIPVKIYSNNNINKKVHSPSGNRSVPR